MPDDNRSEPPSYDTREALQLLSRVSRRDPRTRDIRQMAADQLLQAVLEAASAAGLKARRLAGSDCDFITTADDPYSGVVIGADDEVGIKLARATGSQRADHTQCALEFDAIARKWVGTERDCFLAPVPGEPFPKRSAVAVVAEQIAALLTRKP